MEEYSLDKHILLASADWFQQYITILWPSVPEGKAESVKIAARDTVKEMMSNIAIYWHIPFSAERINKSKNQYVKRLHELGLDEVTVDQILSDIDASDSYEEEDSSLWVFWALTEYLVNSANESKILEDRDQLRELIRRIFHDVNEQLVPLNFEEEFMNSSTAWDEYLKSLTPDLPSFICDYAEMKYAVVEKFKVFWTTLTKHLSRDEREIIVNWYLAEIEKIPDTEGHIDIPDWFM